MSSKIIGYIRISTDRQDLDKQRHLLLEHARRQHLFIDEFGDHPFDGLNGKAVGFGFLGIAAITGIVASSITACTSWSPAASGRV